MALIVAGISVVQPYILARSAVAVSCGADTTEDVLATISVPAGALGLSGWIRLSAYYTLTNSANSKTFRTRFSGSAGTIVATDIVTTQALFRKSYWMANRGAANSQLWSSSASDEAGTGGLGVKGGSFVMVASSVDTASVSTIVISGQKATAGEVLTLEGYLAEVFPTV